MASKATRGCRIREREKGGPVMGASEDEVLVEDLPGSSDLMEAISLETSALTNEDDEGNSDCLTCSPSILQAEATLDQVSFSSALPTYSRACVRSPPTRARARSKDRL